MRVWGAIALTLGLLLGTYYYTSFADSVRREPKEIAVEFDDGNWSLHLVRTFDCINDPNVGTPSLIVQIKGVNVFHSDQKINSSDPVVIEPIEGIEIGQNEIYIEANLGTLDSFEPSDESAAIRITLKRGQRDIADETFWVEKGASEFSRSVLFEVGKQTEDSQQHDGHDH